MNRKKKLISVILVLAMLISSFAVTMPVAAAESASVGNTTENTATKTATVLGDMNSDGEVNTDDAIYLLRHVLMSSKYPISQSGDVNGDKEVNTDDAIYLLRHVLMPSKYPILSKEDEIVEDSDFTILSGEFTDKEIKSEEAAILAVQEVAEELNLGNAADELTVKSENTIDGTTYYRLQQNYKGIPVYGSSVVVIADENGTAQGLTGNATEIDNVDTTPSVDYTTVKEAVSAHFETLVFTPELSENDLTIFRKNDGAATLAYEFEVLSNNEYFSVIVDANSGEVLQCTSLTYTAESNIPTVQEMLNDRVDVYNADGNRFCSWMWVINGTQYLCDKSDNLYDWDGNKKYSINEDGDLLDTKNKLVDISGWEIELKYILYSLESNGSNSVIYHSSTDLIMTEPNEILNSEKAEALVEELAKSHSFFESVLSRNGYDNRDGDIIAVIEDASSNNNAYSASWAGKTIICWGTNKEIDTDLVAHEYMHSVENSISGMIYLGQSGAIMEGYSDLFGEIVEDWSNDGLLNGNCDWENEWERILSNPSKNNYPEKYLGSNWISVDSSIDHGGVHQNSTVISHAAYLMTQSSTGGTALTMEELANLWYETLFALPSNCSVEALRDNMLLVAKSIGFSESKIKCITSAFEKVAITGNLEYTLSSDGKYYIVSGVGTIKSNDIFIPETYKDLPVKEIAEKAFYGSSIKSVTIPASVTKIGNYAFAKSKSLTQVNTAEGLLEIGTAAFEDCTELKEITIPNTVKTIGVQAFYKCSSIIEIAIPDGVTTIGFCMFAECSKLETIDLPNTITYIGERAFENCTSLKKIVFNGTKSEWSAITKNSEWDRGAGSYTVTYTDDEESENKPTSEGLKYTLSSDGTYYSVSGIGTCTDTEIVIPEKYNNLPVKKIAAKAFQNCRTIRSVIIPGSITNIGNNAFDMCNIVSVVISEGVETIESEAFFSCQLLTNVEIPSTVQNISVTAFSCCYKLENIVVSANNAIYKSVDGVCYTKDGTTLVCYPCGKTEVSFDVPDEVEIIGAQAFRNNLNLKNVSIPEGVIQIDTWTFFGCKSLTTIEIPNSVKSIGNMVLYNCTSLTTINFLGTETEWNAITKGSRWDANTGDYTVVFESETNGSKGLAYTLSSDGTYYSVSSIGTCTDTDIVIPATYNGLPVSDIGGRAFYECKNLRSVTMPNSVMSIGDEAFYYCTSLTSVTIPNSVTNIGDVAFCGCGNLTSVTIPDSVTSIGTSAFGYCGSLTNIFVEENNINYKSLNGNLYSKDGKMLILYAIGKKETSFIIPSSVTTIGYAAFSGCTSLINITIPNSVTIIGESAFNACKGLVNVTIPDSVTQIFNYAFSGCTSLTSVTIPDSVIGLGFCVFYCCTSLASVTIPDSVTSIGSMVFGYCRGLTSVTMPRSVTWIGSSMFYECNSLTSVTIPDSVSSIDSEAFYNCTNLTEIVFEGTRSQWEAINKDADWDKNAGAFTVKCTDGDIVADGEEIPVISITLSETQIVMPAGSSQYIEVSVYPENATNQLITWTTGSFSVADIAWSGENNYRGLIVANSEGTTVITASTADGKVLAQCTVIVYVA